MNSPQLAVAQMVLQTISARAPLAWQGRDLPLDLPLGAGGLGMDSIAMVELLIECESAVGIAFPADLFDPGPLTVGRLVAHAAQRES